MSQDFLACLTLAVFQLFKPPSLIPPRSPSSRTCHQPLTSQYLYPHQPISWLKGIEPRVLSTRQATPTSKPTEPGGAHPHLSSQVLLTDGNYIFVSHQLHGDSAGDREPEMMPDFSLRADTEFWKVTQEGKERGICEKALWGRRTRSRSSSCPLQLPEFRNNPGQPLMLLWTPAQEREISYDLQAQPSPRWLLGSYRSQSRPQPHPGRKQTRGGERRSRCWGPL